jgi:hypothetical protein
VTTPTCPYCSQPAKLVTGAVIYPHRPDLADGQYWSCEPCDAYVGCHRSGIGYGDGTRPLGRLADAGLRRAKSAAHRAFDPMWKDGTFTRKQAYLWLAGKLGIPVNSCHIGEFDETMCLRVIQAVKDESCKHRASKR